MEVAFAARKWRPQVREFCIYLVTWRSVGQAALLFHPVGEDDLECGLEISGVASDPWHNLVWIHGVAACRCAAELPVIRGHSPATWAGPTRRAWSRHSHRRPSKGHDLGVDQSVLANGLPGNLAFAFDVLVPGLLRQPPVCALVAQDDLQRVVGIRLIVPDCLPN